MESRYQDGRRSAPIGQRGRTFVLFGGFFCGTLAGGWLGLVAPILSGLAAPDPPRFADEGLVAAIVAGGVLYALVYRTGGKSARNDLLFVAIFAAFVVLLSVDVTGVVTLLAPLPALLVGLPFALIAVL